MRTVSSFLKIWPFLSLGLLTAGLFLSVESFGDRVEPLIPVVRVLIIPLWLMRTLEMVVGMGSWPMPLQYLIALPLLFVPYVAADLLLGRVRRRISRHREAEQPG
jgi:hypothetical protein